MKYVGKAFVYEDDRVVLEDDSKNVFYTRDLTCPTIVVENVVKMHNEGADIMEIDAYLLNEGLCTQDDREIIVEGIYNILN